MKEEYNLMEKLDKVALFFKYLFYFIVFIAVIYFIYVFSFGLYKITPYGQKNKCKKALVNISFSSIDDLKKSEKFLKDYDLILYNRSNTPFEIKEFMPIYEININNKGSIYSVNKDFKTEDFFNNKYFYFFKHRFDSTGYGRGGDFIPKFEELYSGKVVFEHFFNSYIDFGGLVSGIIFNDDLYAYEYSKEIKKIVFESIKKTAFKLSSYGNKDSSTHKNLLKAYSVYYKGDFFYALKKGDYFLVNELIADGRYFKFERNDNEFSYKIGFKEKMFTVYVFKDAYLFNKTKRLKNTFKLDKGDYKIVVVKNENNFLGDEEVFWLYMNFKVD